MVLGLFSTKSVELKHENKVALDAYKYQGGDNGITYIYFHSPFAEKIASILPMWMPPNLITLIAALCLVVPHIISFIVYGSGFGGPVHDWYGLVVGLLHFTYITLDNVDGKQARRTGSSSPLGQMFDHGCDAITFSIGVMTVSRFRQLGSGYLTFAFLCLAPTGYFMYNMKEYYMGEYFLPIINPVSEASIIDLIFVFYCFFTGWQELQKPVFYDLNVGQCFAGTIVIFQIYQNIEMFIEILTAQKYEKPMRVPKFLVQFSSYWLCLILCVTLSFLYDYERVERPLVYMVVFSSSYLVLHLIIGHLADKEFRPYSSIPFLFALAMMISCVVFHKSALLQDNAGCVFYGIALYLLANSLISFMSIITQMENLLGIKAFSVKRKEKAK